MGLNILLVEDDIAQAELIRSYLHRAGHRTVHTKTISKTIQVIDKAEEEFGLVILDLNLPDSRGLETFTIINLKRPLIAILIFSGVFDVELAEKAVEQGAGGFLLKTDVAGVPKLLELQIALAIKNHKLNLLNKERLDVLRRAQQTNLAQLKNMPTHITACAVCNKVKNTSADTSLVKWIPIEKYLEIHGVEITHGYCPEHMNEQINKLVEKGKKK